MLPQEDHGLVASRSRTSDSVGIPSSTITTRTTSTTSSAASIKLSRSTRQKDINGVLINLVSPVSPVSPVSRNTGGNKVTTSRIQDKHLGPINDELINSKTTTDLGIAILDFDTTEEIYQCLRDGLGISEPKPFLCSRLLGNLESVGTLLWGMPFPNSVCVAVRLPNTRPADCFVKKFAKQLGNTAYVASTSTVEKGVKDPKSLHLTTYDNKDLVSFLFFISRDTLHAYLVKILRLLNKQYYNSY